MGKCSNAFFSETTNMIKAKLYTNIHWMVLYKLYVFVPSLPRGGGGILFYLCPSVQDIFRHIFLRNGRNLIFGHKLHIGTPYRGKRFLTHQIPTSCLPKSGGIISELSSQFILFRRFHVFVIFGCYLFFFIGSITSFCSNTLS
jgi:hypothetical protein